MGTTGIHAAPDVASPPKVSFLLGGVHGRERREKRKRSVSHTADPETSISERCIHVMAIDDIITRSGIPVALNFSLASYS